MDNLVDWRKMNNRELAMRIKTGITSGKEFFTDLNGFQVKRAIWEVVFLLQPLKATAHVHYSWYFTACRPQMIKRKRLEKIPLQANYYPMPSMAYIQDADR